MWSKSYVGMNLVVENQIAYSFWGAVPPDTLACFRDTLLCLAPSLQVTLDPSLIDVQFICVMGKSYASNKYKHSQLFDSGLLYLALLCSKAYTLQL